MQIMDYSLFIENPCRKSPPLTNLLCRACRAHRACRAVSDVSGYTGRAGRTGLCLTIPGCARLYRACRAVPAHPAASKAADGPPPRARQTKKHPPRIARGGCRPCFSFLRRASAAHCGACGANCPASGASPDAASASSPTSSSAPSLMRLSRARPDATSSSPSTTV